MAKLYLGRNFIYSGPYNSNPPFNKNTYLAELTIGNMVTAIVNEAFQGCGGLKEITIVGGESTLYFGEYVFEDVNMTKLYLGRNFTYSGSLSENPPFDYNSSLSELTIGNQVSSIGDGAFRGCSGLVSIVFPGSLNEIGQNAFNGCSSLKDIECYAMTPPSVYDNSFDAASYSNATLTVRAEAVSEYKKNWHKPYFRCIC